MNGLRGSTIIELMVICCQSLINYQTGFYSKHLLVLFKTVWPRYLYSEWAQKTLKELQEKRLEPQPGK